MSEERYKASHYNFKIELSDNSEGDALLYNTLNGMLIKIPANQRENVDSLLATPNQPVTDDNMQGLKHKLLECRFLVQETIDEIGFLKVKNRSARFGWNSMFLTVAPTFNCNFRCPYCYENRQNISMSEETVDSLQKFIKWNIDDQGIKRATIAWYGGEPLLEKKTMFAVTDMFREIDFQAYVYTNGYLLDPAFVERLDDLHINLLYITLDGSRDFHDKRRYLQGGLPTYDRIKKNIYNVVKRWGDKIQVVIRANLDAENIDTIEPLMADFSSLRGPVRFAIARTGLKSDCEKYPFEVFKDQDFEKKRKNIEDKILDSGFGEVKLPRQSFNSCPADLFHTYCVDPEGTLFKCLSQMNPASNPLGRLSPDGQIEYNEETYIRWYSYDVFDSPECRECLLLPFCMGGCPVTRWPVNPKARPDGPKPCYMGKDFNAIANRVKKYYHDVYLNQQ